MDLNAVSRQDLINLLVQDVARELSLWIQQQADLGATGAPLDERPIVLSAPAQTPSPSTTRRAPTKQTTQETVSPRPSAVLPPSPAAPTRTTPSCKAMTSAFNAFRRQRDDSELTVDDRRHKLNIFRARIQNCTACEFYAKRRRVMTSDGDVCPKLMFVSFGASSSDGATGAFLAPDACRLFQKWLSALTATFPDFSPEDIYTTHLVKCFYNVTKRIQDDTIKRCLPHLREEIQIVRPKVIVVFGGIVYQSLFATPANIALVRGEVKRFNDIPLVATHHPGEILLKYAKNEPEQIREAALLEERVLGDLELAIRESRR